MTPENKNKAGENPPAECCENPRVDCNREARFGVKFADGETLLCNVCTTKIIANAPEWLTLDGCIRELFCKCEKCGEYERTDNPLPHHICKECFVGLR